MHSGIPTIDFARFLNGSIEGRQQTVAETDTALRTASFFLLQNHGIERAKTEKCFDWSRRFFALSDPEKEILCPASRSTNYGYLGMEKEQIRGQTCNKESFDFYNPVDGSVGNWPTEESLPGFRDFAADFHQDCAELIDKLLECLSMALDLSPDESLSQYHTSSKSVLSLIHYPAISAKLLRSGQVVRNPTHADFGTLTLLFQQEVGGLEMADMSSTDKTSSSAVEKSGKFIHVQPDPETIFVNVGYLLMRWTNARWKNSVHRVSEPLGIANSDMIPERYSVAFFSSPNDTAIVQPLASCCSDQNPPKFGPLNAGEYLLKKRVALHK